MVKKNRIKMLEDRYDEAVKIVFEVIEKNAGGVGGVVPQKTVVEEVGKTGIISEAAVYRYISEMEEEGFIEKQKTNSGNNLVLKSLYKPNSGL